MMHKDHLFVCLLTSILFCTEGEGRITHWFAVGFINKSANFDPVAMPSAQ